MMFGVDRQQAEAYLAGGWCALMFVVASHICRLRSLFFLGNVYPVIIHFQGHLLTMCFERFVPLSAFSLHMLLTQHQHCDALFFSTLYHRFDVCRFFVGVCGLCCTMFGGDLVTCCIVVVVECAKKKRRTFIQPFIPYKVLC